MAQIHPWVEGLENNKKRRVLWMRGGKLTPVIGLVALATVDSLDVHDPSSWIANGAHKAGRAELPR